MTLDARCRTFVPTTLNGYFSQQLRWRRSNIVDYAGGFSHAFADGNLAGDLCGYQRFAKRQRNGSSVRQLVIQLPDCRRRHD